MGREVLGDFSVAYVLGRVVRHEMQDVCVDSKHTHHRDGGPNPFYFGCRNNRTNSLTDHAEFHMSNTMQAGQNQLNQMDPLHDSMMMKQNDGFLDLFKAYV